MEIIEGAFIKATVNGKPAGFTVFNNKIWLLSYVTAWDEPTRDGYDDVPRHGFFKKKIVWHLGSLEPLRAVNESTFESWRNSVVATTDTIASFMRTIAFPGEDGYEREIRRRSRRNADTATEPATTETETPSETAPNEHDTEPATVVAEPRPDIDFYLPNYKTDNIYRGQHGYHNSHASGFLNQPNVPFDGHRIGVELEVVAKTNDYRDEIVAKTSNWFTRERDGSLPSTGIEFITIPLLPDDAKSYRTWQPLCDYLKTRAKSWDTDCCGLHVHIGREILGDTEDERQMTLGKLLIFYQGDVEKWVKATAVFGRERCYHQPDGDTDEIKAVRCLGKSVLKDPDVYAQVDAAMKSKFSTSRYYAINLDNTHTIEFRKGRGSINSDRIIAVITMTEAICLFAKATAPSDLTLENFQSWLFHNVPCGNPMFRYLNITQPDA